MRFDGQIDIRLQLEGTRRDAQVTSVVIESSRQTQTATLLRGRTVTEAQQLIGMVFGICGNAQGVAAARALESAQQITPDPITDGMRQAITDIETLREHLWRILLGWPAHTESTPDHATLAEVISGKQTIEHALGNLTHWLTPAASPLSVDQSAISRTLAQLQQLVETQVLGVSCEHWLSLSSNADLIELIEQHPEDATPAVRLIRRILARQWQSACQADSSGLPSMGIDPELTTTLIGRMQNPDFISQPDWQSQCCETTSFSRSTAALTQSLQAHHGNGLLVRATALLSEVAELILKLSAFFAQQHLFGAPYPHDLPVTHGLGQVSAARGQLFHWAEMDDDLRSGSAPKIREYRILAPTEWNFHPAGVVSQSLSGLSGTVDDIRQQAALLAELVDPCVGYQLALMDGDKPYA